MFLSAENVIVGIVVVVLVVLIFLITYIFLYTSLYKNKQLKILNINSADETLKESYGDNLKRLISDDYINSIEQKYINVFNNFEKQVVNKNILYKSKYQQGKKILITINMCNESQKNEVNGTLLHIHGEQVRNGKSLFYVIIEAINTLLKKEDFTLNLSVLLIYNNKDILESITERYDLVLNEDSEILDPITSKLRSYYAFIGNVRTGLATINFTTDIVGNGKLRINEFIKEVTRNFTKSYLSTPILKIIQTIGKDMIFSDRIVAINPIVFKPFIINLIHESNFKFIYGIKTKIKFNEVVTNKETYSCMANIEFGINKDLIGFLKKINPYLIKYGISYEIIENVEQTKCVANDNRNYRIIENTIKETYNDIYVSPAIVEGNRNYNLNVISDCIISFSPLYYSHNAKINFSKGVEYVSCGSLVYGVEFYTRLFEEYIRRNKCVVDFVEEI